MEIKPFEMHVAEDVLDDLGHRLSNTRWPDEIPDTGWDYGSNLKYMMELVEYWRTDFNWRAQEKLINSFDHFMVDVEGQAIHFIHERGTGLNPMPLILTHGWPGSFFEMHKIIPLLADPASHGGDPKDSFDVVAPSLPGYGFSGRPTRRGVQIQKVADYWESFMTQGLGYERFGAQGGDLGAGVTARLGSEYAQNLIGIHLTSVNRPSPYLGPEARALSEAEKAHLNQRDNWQQTEGGYAHMHRTKPQTLAYGLNDSPAGLAAWIAEKYRTWSDCHGDLESRFTKDELLTTITIYWITQTINSSTRMYFENQNHSWDLNLGESIHIPTAMAVFPQEISHPPREWAERSYSNLHSWTEMPRGGHFAALEEPELLAEDIRAFFRPLRSR